MCAGAGQGTPARPTPPQWHPSQFRGSKIFLAFPRRSGPVPRARGHPGGALPPPLCFSASPPSFPFCISANLGHQTWLVDCFPMSAPQLWWGTAPVDQPEGRTELGARNWAAQAPTHTNPVCSPLCRLPRFCFLESNLHFGSSRWHLTICCSFFRGKTKKKTPICFAVSEDDGQSASSGAGW